MSPPYPGTSGAPLVALFVSARDGAYLSITELTATPGPNNVDAYLSMTEAPDAFAPNNPEPYLSVTELRDAIVPESP